MKKELIINIFVAYLASLGIGISLGYGYTPLLVVFAIAFAVTMVVFMKISKDIEREKWENDRKLSKMFNDNEKAFQDVYRALARKQDKYPKENIKPGSRPSKAYERMVKLYDGRAEDQAAPTVQTGMVEGRSDDSARKAE